MVAIAVMALLAVLSWRGLDGMTRAQAQTQLRADEVLTLQAGLDQWGADLDAMVQLPQFDAINWDGRVLRLTRRSTVSPYDGALVVAWARRNTASGSQWLRWQSPALLTRGDLQDAWDRAALWAQNPSDEEKKREVAIVPLEQWQIFYYRSDAWTNPLSSDGTTPPSGGTTPPGTPPTTGTTTAAVPDGVRLVLTLPPGQALSGTLVRDWVRPIVGGGKS
ncbi:PulJ/GspJ family protein [Variovorax terrae]|uniref:General secretion pathway protein J n=1 Tax=Variovorax terrae TaxID=2923278 RepID=A0A9X1VZB4_9BURK|nr:hypothetical protein [Variovorax terrae]MCJ0764939.1 general secretion pathway protein J [Variovorax terrae]